MTVPIHRVLVVDDCPVDSAVIAAQLESLHKVVDVKCISNPQDVDDAVSDFTPNMVVLDIHMPFSNGLDVLRSLKSQSKNQDTKMVILSGAMNDKQRQLADELGAAECLIKPTTLLDYRDLARQLIDTHLN